MIKLIKIIYFIILSFYFLFFATVNAQEKIKIGLLVPMTGENKEIGESIIKVNSVSGLLYGVESGVGLAALPEYLVSSSSNIIKVLPKVEGPITEAHFVYPQSLKNTARVQAFRNFLFSKIGDWK